MKAFIVFIGSIVLLAIASWFLLTYVLISDEQKIQRVIEKTRRSVENGSLLSLSNQFATDYHHENGMGRDEVLGVLRELFQQTTEREIRILHSEIRLNKPQADARVTFLFKGQVPHAHPVFQTLLKDSSNESQEVHITFVLDGRDWKIQQSSLYRAQEISEPLTSSY